MKRELTPLQSVAFGFIAASIAGGVAPTRREIAEACGIRNHSQVDRIIIALEYRGLVRKQEGKARGLTLVNGGMQVSQTLKPANLGLTLPPFHILATIE